MSYKLEIELPLVPPTLNKVLRMHRFERNRFNKNIYAAVKGLITHYPEKPLSKARITIIRYFYRSMDWDGIVGSMKPVVDALQYCKIIKDDSYKVTGPWDVTEQFRAKKDGPLTYLKVEDG